MKKIFIITLIFIILITFITIGIIFFLKFYPNKSPKNQIYRNSEQVKEKFLQENLNYDYDYCEYNYIEKVADRTFICYNPHCYDLYSKKIDLLSNTYQFDYMTEIDPGGDKNAIFSPYDNGYITHLIFEITISPSKKFFNAKYKGFISSINIEDKKRGIIHNKKLNIYYDTSKKIISNSQLYVNFKGIETDFDNKTPSSFYLITKECFLKF